MKKNKSPPFTIKVKEQCASPDNILGNIMTTLGHRTTLGMVTKMHLAGRRTPSGREESNRPHNRKAIQH